MRPTSGPGPAALRQALPTSMPPTVNMRGRPSILRDSAASCRSRLWRLGELAQRGDVALAFCWSHVRRQTPAPIATEALVRIAALYANRKRARHHRVERAPL